jgi:hypothetical protein
MKFILIKPGGREINAVRSYDTDRFSELMTCQRPPTGGPDSVKKKGKKNTAGSYDTVGFRYPKPVGVRQPADPTGFKRN